MTATAVLDHVHAYALAVRAHLGDLPPDQVEDLTDGLEADLAEALQDAPRGGTDEPSGAVDLERRFGHPAAYATELRTAAGLAPRAQAGAVPRRRSPLRALRTRWDETVRAVEQSPAGPVLVGLTPSLRPLWWVLRGWVWFVVLGAVGGVLLGTYGGSLFVPDGGRWLGLLALVTVSFLLGARAPALRRGGRLVRGASVAAAVLALPLLMGLLGDLGRLAAPPEAADVWVPEDGVWVEGQQVENLYAYDAEGRALDGVQLFDERGRPVVATGQEGWLQQYVDGLDEEWLFAPTTGAGGRTLWNVYPLVGAPADDWEWGDDGPELRGQQPAAPPAPFARAAAVERPGTTSTQRSGSTDTRPGATGGRVDPPASAPGATPSDAGASQEAGDPAGAEPQPPAADPGVDPATPPPAGAVTP